MNPAEVYSARNTRARMSLPIGVKTGNPLTSLVEVERHRLVANSALALSRFSTLIRANQPVIFMVDFATKTGRPSAAVCWLHDQSLM
jgi:hypothetical protein